MEPFVPLVKDAQHGDQSAFGDLLRRFQDMAVGYAYTILHDWQLAEDAAQEAFIEACRTIAQLREPYAFPTWLRRIVFKQCDRITRRKRVSEVPLIAASIVAAGQQPYQAVEGAEMNAQISDAIQALPAEERTVLILFYLSGYSHKDIAAFLELRLATVNNRLRSARSKLREHLERRITDMVTENLQTNRPSRNEEFAERVLSFINAADSGYAGDVKAMLAKNPELVDEKGRARYSNRDVRALHYALNYGHIEVIEQLLTAGADINAKEGETWAPIHYALLGAHPELAPMLVERGADVDIYAAAGLGDSATLKALIAEQPDLVHQQGPGGATPLHFATTAAVANHLLEYGADANAQDSRGRAALAWCSDHDEVVGLLLANGAELTDIFMACALGKVEEVEKLLDAEPGLLHQHKDPRVGTPLHVAADKGRLEVAKLLVERGAAVNAVTDSGNITPMHDAAFSGRTEMVEFLLSQGADPTALDTEFNAPPLAWARFNGQGEVVALLS